MRVRGKKNLHKKKKLHCHLKNGYFVTINQDENYAVMFSNVTNRNKAVHIGGKSETEKYHD